MKPSDEMRNAFPQPDERFKACIRRTLYDLSSQKERRTIPMKHAKLRVGVLTAVALLLLTTIAVGAAALHYGVFDFMNPALGQPLPEATQLVQTPQATAQVELQASADEDSAQTSAVTFSVREALYDGVSANVIVAATPTDDSVLLLPADSSPEYPITDLGLEGTQTIAQYAAEHGKTKLYCLSIIDQGVLDGTAGFVGSQDFRMEPDGTLVICVSNNHASADPSVPIELICTAAPMDIETGSRDVNAIERASLTFTLNQSGQAAATRLFSNPVEFPEAGVTVQSVELKSTSLGLYYTITCKVTDQAAYDKTEDGVHFWFLDESGHQIESAAAASGGESSFPDENGVFTQIGALAPCQTLPDSLTLKAISIWEDKKDLGTNTLR